jgi:hypothetical protein
MATARSKPNRTATTRHSTATFLALRPQQNEDGVPLTQRFHVYGKSHVCRTDARGFAQPKNRSPLDLVLDASNGFIPLWAKNTTLLWRFQERSLNRFANPDAVKAIVEKLMADAVLAWGDAVPVKFAKATDIWDFEIVVNANDDCDPAGCTLARAFFPDSGRHDLAVFPKMFDDVRAEQVETMAHELGHVFGLRHFFAQVSETAWPSAIFGKHRKVSIMNYGANSKLTTQDRKDLKKLYQMAWSGQLTAVNGTPVKLVQPFSAT